MSSVDPGLSIDARPHFLQALRRILRPIIRLMIRSGVRYDEFADLARGAYVDSAIHDGIGEVTHPSPEQILWATGIEPERLDNYRRMDTHELAPTRTSIQVVIEVLHRWHTNSRFLNEHGGPQDLEFDSASNESFRSLVAQVDKNADPAFILNEILKSKSAVYLEDNRIRAVTRSYIWPTDSVAGVEYFWRALNDLSQTLEYNFDPANAERKRLERSMFADRGISADLLPAFNRYTQERASQFLNDLDDWLARFPDISTEDHGDKIVAGIYVFMYVETPKDMNSLANLTNKPRSPLRG